MTETAALLDELTRQENLLLFRSFSNDDAIGLGLHMLEAARSQSMTLAIDITRGQHQLFHAALPGTRPDHDHWIARKRETVYRFGRSTYFMAVDCRLKGQDLATRYGLDPLRFVAAGGGFPVNVAGVGLVGSVTVSGMPEATDHRFVVGCIAAFTGISLE